MATLTVAEFKARFTEFASTAEPQVQVLIDDTVEMFDQGRWGSLYFRGHSLYIAHFLTVRSKQLAGFSGAQDAAQSKQVDGVSATYAVLMPTRWGEAYFATTSYGREYLMLARMVGIGGTAVGW